MNEKQKTVYQMARAMYINKDAPTHSQLQESLEKLNQMFPDNVLTEHEIFEVRDEYERNMKIKSFDPDSIVGETVSSDWLEEKKKNVKYEYWNRYENYLRDEKDFSEDTIMHIKRGTEEILGYCANPEAKSGETKKRKGLVIGDVQSGKTANYMALMNMACDYGYGVILVLAGLTDSLRSQTQERVDEGLVGAVSTTIGSSKIIYVGVGKDKNERYAVTLTNLEKDFSKFSMSAINSTSADYNKPVILVVKKNKSTLENVKNWLKPGKDGVRDHVLIIDDEADNASVNTKKTDDEPSAINRLIRDIYNNFTIASYVGYTATPFANIFINPYDDEVYKDLFPSDFITLLRTPTNYFGAEKVFAITSSGGDSRYLRKINEEEDLFLPVNHKKVDRFNGIPDSMKEAIMSFYINCVIRTKRKQEHSHRSMMINISRFNAVQMSIKEKISDYINYLNDTILQTNGFSKEKFLKDKNMNYMYNLYKNDKYYDTLRDEVSWDDIQSGLSYEASRMKVIVVNRLKDEEKLDYRSYREEGARYIVIGGFVLSRGLTLEGLMVSYYSRNGSAYDTLMQMCRWFGYRNKYEDLCRIYMSDINIENYRAVIDANNDLKEQLIEMKRKHKTPSDYGLMVKTCPDVLNTLIVTSRNKSRTAKDKTITVNYSTQTIDTSKIYWDVNTNKSNLEVLKKELSEKVGNLTIVGNRYMYQSVDKSIIISLLKHLSFPGENTKLDVQSICNFLENDNINSWDIVVATGNESGENQRYFSFGGVDKIPCVKRKFNYRKDANENFIRISGNNNRLIDPGILDSGLDEDDLNELRKNAEGKTLSAKDYLKLRRRPIFIIYPIDLKNEDNSPSKEEIKTQLGNNFLIGIGIGFPYNGEGITVTYKLNKIKQRELMEEDEDDE